MKALSLWQPWASLIAIGAKSIETRSWETLYRGPLAIHAAKKDGILLGDGFLNARQAFRDLGLQDSPQLPHGAIVATCELVDCLLITPTGLERGSVRIPFPSFAEQSFGNYTPGRFAWLLANVQRLETPIPCVGRQRLFNWQEK